MYVCDEAVSELVSCSLRMLLHLDVEAVLSGSTNPQTVNADPTPTGPGPGPGTGPSIPFRAANVHLHVSLQIWLPQMLKWTRMQNTLVGAPSRMQLPAPDAGG